MKFVKKCMIALKAKLTVLSCSLLSRSDKESSKETPKKEKKEAKKKGIPPLPIDGFASIQPTIPKCMFVHDVLLFSRRLV
jgi:hypothetical protein